MLNFPNSSRSYDSGRRCIRFWGHDGALEIPFFINEPALVQIASGTPDSEAALLESFDLNRERILVAARKVHGRRRQGSYELVSADF